MKGVVLSINEYACPVDITHLIDPHDISSAAFVIGNAYRSFPEGTVHVVVVDPGVGTGRRAVAVRADGHFFVGPDNGVFSFALLFGENPCAREIKNYSLMLPNRSSTFHGRDIFAPVAAHLSREVPFSEVGPEISDPEILSPAGFSVDGNIICGHVVYADNFGNLITNIPVPVVKNPSCASVSVGGELMEGISQSYGSVKPGELVAVEGSGGYVEVSVNRGSARDIFGDESPEITITDSVRQKG